MTTAERLENLERELARATRRNNWFLAGLGLAVGLLAVGWLFTGFVTHTVKEVRTKRFVLVDEKGRNRALLSVDNAGPGLSLSDENGHKRVGLAAFKEASGMSLYDEKGENRVMLSVDKTGSALALSDENGKKRAGMAVFRDASGLSLYDENGKHRATLAVLKNGSLLAMFDAHDIERARLRVFMDGPELALFEKNGKTAWSAQP
jgi:hypothetical protein